MQLNQKLAEGKFVILAEMEPPKGADPSIMIRQARRVKELVDGFLVPEMNKAVMRMSSLGGAVVLQQNGMQALMQVCCRDRNRLALQADLLAASACGVQAVMAVRGEDVRFGDHPDAKAVYDLDERTLLDAIQKMQQGKDLAGVDLTAAPRFLIGTSVNAAAKGEPLEQELEAMAEKRKKGVSFWVTPPVFDLDAFGPFLNRIDRTQTPILPTVLLLKSAGMARYMARNLENISIPDSLISRIQSAPDRVQECIRIAAETISAIKAKGFAGVLLSTIGWEDKMPDILEQVR
ncbi:MAG: methylenetetrahydrofolate reductase [Thermodesulfobacteriota bacterium]